MIEKVIEVERMEHVISVFGSFDQNLRLIEEELEVKVIDRDNRIHICGEPEAVMHAEKAINGLLTLAAKGENIDAQNVRYILKLVREGRETKIGDLAGDVICITAKGKPIKAKTLGQKNYCDSIRHNTITLGIGSLSRDTVLVRVRHEYETYDIVVKGHADVYDNNLIFDLEYTGKSQSSERTLRGKGIRSLAKKN